MTDREVNAAASAGGAFRRLDAGGELVGIWFDGVRVAARAGEPLAAALLAGGYTAFRTHPVTGEARGPWCLMGACFECLVTIDGVPDCQACMTPVRAGMRVERARCLKPDGADPWGSK